MSHTHTHTHIYPPTNAGDASSIPEMGRFPGEGNGNPLKYSCLRNPMDRGTWQATVLGVAKESDMTKWLNNGEQHIYNNNINQNVKFHRNNSKWDQSWNKEKSAMFNVTFLPPTELWYNLYYHLIPTYYLPWRFWTSNTQHSCSWIPDPQILWDNIQLF